MRIKAVCAILLLILTSHRSPASLERKPPLGPFVKQRDPILLPQGTGFECKAVFNPAAIMHGDSIYMLYRAEDWTGTGKWNGVSTIGLAVSKDGIDFERHKEPVLRPELPYEIPGGVEDGRIIKVDDTFYLTYTAYDGVSARLCLATSKDLMNWQKKGPIISWDWSKSGAILSEKIGDRYIMYFGDSNIWIACSNDLLRWEVEARPVLRPRKGYFDSRLVEPGPPPIVTADGILLIYNGADDSNRYSVGWVLFSKDDPTKVMARADQPILEPTESWEKYGQVYNVTFAEGLVKKGDTWYLYYGAADTYVGVATFREKESVGKRP